MSSIGPLVPMEYKPALNHGRVGPVREIDMPRFIQQNSNNVPKKEPKPRSLPKPGQYTSQNLTEAKKIITPEGGKR